MNTVQAMKPTMKPIENNNFQSMKKTSVLVTSNAVVAMLSMAVQSFPIPDSAPWIRPAILGFGFGWVVCSLMLLVLVEDFDRMRAIAKRVAKVNRRNRRLRYQLNFTVPLQDESGNLVDRHGNILCPYCWADHRKVHVFSTGICPTCHKDALVQPPEKKSVRSKPIS